MTSILLVAAVLFVIIVVFAIIMFIAAKRSSAANRKMVENMRLQSRYMDNTEAFCQQTGEMIDSIEAAIAEGSIAGNDEAYLAKCGEILTLMHGGDSVSEAVIADKKFLCQELGIQFIDEIRRLPEAGQMDEMDLVSILGNLLDNAIEAAKQVEDDDRFVKCESNIDRNVWRLTITNSKRSDIKISGGNMPTTKADKANHGLGTRIVRTAVGKYHGQIRFNDDKDEFAVRVKIMLKIEYMDNM